MAGWRRGGALVAAAAAMVVWVGPVRPMARRAGQACLTDVPMATSVVSNEDLQRLPSGRSMTQLANVTPAIGDVTGDGCRDVVGGATVNGQGRVVVYPGYGDGTFMEPTLMDVEGVPTAIATGRLNADAIEDIVVVTDGSQGPQYGAVYGGALNVPIRLRGFDAAGYGRVNSARTADLDGDGLAEILMAQPGQGGQGRMSLFDGRSLSPKLSLELPSFGAFGIGRSNMPGPTGAPDDDLDLFATAPGGLTVWENNGGTFSRSGTLAIPGGGFASGTPAVGDFNGDRRPDVAVGSTNGQLHTFYGADGVGGYGLPQTRMTGGGTSTGAQAFNFNGDGVDDLALFSSRGPATMGTAEFFTGGAQGWQMGPSFPLPMSVGGAVSAGSLVDGLDAEAAVFMRQMGMGPDFFGATYPGGPFERHAFTRGPGSDLYDLDDLDINLSFTSPLGRTQAMFVEIEAALIAPPVLRYQFGGGRTPLPTLAARTGWAGAVSASLGTSRRFDRPGEFGQGTASAAAVLRGSLTSLGASTGEAMALTVMNAGARPGRVRPGVFVVEPYGTRQPAQAVAGARTVNTNAYCLDFGKETPAEGTAFRVASAATQQRMAPMKRVLDAANRLAESGGLHPDSAPTDYVHAIKQWSLWAQRENWDLRKFREAFVQRTKKNLQAMKQNWTREIEAEVTALVPGRWRDIAAVLAASN